MTENGQLRGDFPSRIWETLIMSDPVQISPAGHFPSQIWETWTGSDMIKAGWLRRDFPSQIWEALIVSDPVQSWGGGFSVTNLGNLDRIRHDQGWLAEG